MTDVNSIQPVDEEDFKIKAFDLESLLYNWIEELLFRFDTRNMLYSKFEVAEIKDNEECLLLGRIWGEPFDLNKHPQKTGVKAVTYHRMEIKRKGEKVQLNFILDI
jgi:SHS2 domain-containing protein